MNCECLYYCNGATENELKTLARGIDSLCVDLYPITISRISGDLKTTTGYRLGCKRIIPSGSLVLFVGGKYHNMDIFRVGKRIFYHWFPEKASELVYEDIYYFSTNEIKTETGVNSNQIDIKPIKKGTPLRLGDKRITNSKWTIIKPIQLLDIGVSELSGREVMCIEIIPSLQCEYLYFSDVDGTTILFAIQKLIDGHNYVRVLMDKSEQQIAFDLYKRSKK